MVLGGSTILARWETQGLSGMMAVTPDDINAAVLETTSDVAEEYFPKKSTAFMKKLEDGDDNT